ncbi:MAG: hypothetical protein IJD35_04840 [Clostridia bacterium]|nr:hypothetical protein [Clostridia bacterium]
MDQNQTPAKQKNLKKKRIVILLATIGVLLLLVLLKTIDFETSPTEEAPEAPYVPETYPAHLFVDPDYESNIWEYPTYKDLDHSISYSFDGQTVDLKNNLKTGSLTSYDKPFDEFFAAYFAALAKGNANGEFDAFYSDVYFRTHKPFGRFAPQKVHDIAISRRTEEQTITQEEKEEDAIYIGCTLTSFEVRYRIYHNDGTFRRDILGDDIIVQYIDLLGDKNGNYTVNSVGYGRHKINPPEKSILPLILPIVWIVLSIVGLVLFFILKKKEILAASAVTFVTFLVSISGSLLWQFVAFGILAVALALYLVLKQRKKKQETTETT